MSARLGATAGDMGRDGPTAEQVALSATGAAPPANQWAAREVAVDLLHHTVYALATGIVFTRLDRQQ